MHTRQISDSVTSIQGSLDESEAGQTSSPPQRGVRFWIIMTTLCMMSILSALENTVVTTSLPFIARKLNMGENYIWVVHIFFLTNAAVQPLFGQIANIFGRRELTIFIVVVFTLGSGICGGSTTGTMLIIGRSIQGIGSGGINMIVEVIISDMVPLRERGKYMAYVLTVAFVGTAIGPWLGGLIVDHISWRWVFYINLPVGGFSLVLILFFFFQVHDNKEMSFARQLRRIDYLGNVIVMGATASVLFALTYGGTRYDWSSWRVILPLVLGLVSLPAFWVFERSRFVQDPVVPTRLFANRTSTSVFLITFVTSAILCWALFFLSVYFQAVLGSSPEHCGLQLMPIIASAVPAAVSAVCLLSRFGRYKPLHIIGFTLSIIGLGLFNLLDAETSTAKWAIFEMVAGAGSGVVINTLLPACQAGLAESDQAAATATWSFVRSFGNIWGVGISSAIFNTRFDQLSSRIPDPVVREALSRGHAYEYSSASFLHALDPVLHRIVVGVYVDSLKRVWEVAVVFAGVTFLLVFLEKELPLRTNLETEFGLQLRESGHGGGKVNDEASTSRCALVDNAH